MVSGKVRITCQECHRSVFHHAKNLCFNCYQRDYQRRYSPIQFEIEEQVEKEGPASNWICYRCDKQAGVEWYKDNVVCLACTRLILREVRLDTRRLTHIMRTHSSKT